MIRKHINRVNHISVAARCDGMCTPRCATRRCRICWCKSVGSSRVSRTMPRGALAMWRSPACVTRYVFITKRTCATYYSRHARAMPQFRSTRAPAGSMMPSVYNIAICNCIILLCFSTPVCLHLLMQNLVDAMQFGFNIHTCDHLDFKRSTYLLVTRQPELYFMP